MDSRCRSACVARFASGICRGGALVGVRGKAAGVGGGGGIPRDGGRRAGLSRPAGGFDGPSRCREGGRTMCAPTGGLSKHFGWRGTVYWGGGGTLGPAGVFYRGFSEDGHGAPGRRALRVGHRTWFVKTGVGAHSLRVECARPSPVRWVSIERAHNVRPYNRYRKVRRHLRHWASATTPKVRGQVGRGGRYGWMRVGVMRGRAAYGS